MDKIERCCDMRGGNKLQLFVGDDGDIHVSIMPERYVLPSDSSTIEFCSSGTQSHHTLIALHELKRAMQKDEEIRPQAHLLEPERRKA